MLVTNTTLSIIGIPLTAAEQKTFKAKVLQLLPGANTPSDKEWAAARKHVMVQRQIDAGHLVELTEAAEEPAGDDDEGDELGDESEPGEPRAGDLEALAKLSQSEAVKLVKATINAELLGRWAEVDKRPKVKDAIAKQLKELSPTNPSGAKGKDLAGDDDESDELGDES